MKRTRRQSGAGEVETQLASSPSASPDHKRARASRDGQEVDEVDVAAIVRALQQKDEWQRKVADPTIAAKWRAEALAQGASIQTVGHALAQLLRQSVVGSAASAAALGCSLALKTQEGEDEDDDDLRVEWDEADSYPPTRNDVCWRDGVVPEELRKALEAKLDAIAAAPEKDFHPGSEGKVQDLIHPSLYPYIRGLSFEPNASSAPPEIKTKVADLTKVFGRDDDEVNAEIGEDEEDEEKGDEEIDYEEFGGDADREKLLKKKEKLLEEVESIYQWLPAEFVVDADGGVTIESYINNLDRKRHAGLYDDIAAVFRIFLPLFEMVLAEKKPLHGRRLQVIVKAANYVLQPGQTHEGSWHVEGMRHERIAASGIYYYSTTPNLPDSALYFREKRANILEERTDTQGFNFHKNLGKADTPSGRCLVFENHLQHKVKGMSNTSTEVGLRKILCFFLVDPDQRVKSSADIPEQQWDEIKAGVARALVEATVAHRVPLPRELLQRILELAKWGFTLEEAKAHRETLMWERKFMVTATNEIWEREFSFCEH